MTLIKTSLLNAIAVIIKMAAMLGINKVLAIYVGPAGYAAIGQFQNAVQMITTFASGAINTGVTKYTAEYGDEPDKQITVWRTASTISIMGALVTSVLIAVFYQQIASLVFHSQEYASVFLWFATSLIFFVVNSLILAILNGKKEIIKFIIINITGSLFSLVVIGLMVLKFQLYGALVGLVIYQSLNFFVIGFFVFKSEWFKFHYFFGRIDKKVAKNLAKYAAMALTSAVCVPVSHILIRTHLGETLGWEAAGYWEAMWRLSGAYLMFVTTTLSVYYLPRLSELKTPQEIKNEILQGYKVILPVAVACGLVIYLLRDFMIGVLFTTDFNPMRELFAWQMLGDTLKIGSWILAYLMLGKAMIKLFIITEILFSASFYGLVVLFVNQYGIEGSVIAHAVNYALYWVVMTVMIVISFNKSYEATF